MDGWHRDRPGRRRLAATLAICLTGLPLCQAWADAISDRGRAGQTAGRAAGEALSLPSVDLQTGAVTLYPDSTHPQSQSLGELFPGSTIDATAPSCHVRHAITVSAPTVEEVRSCRLEHTLQVADASATVDRACSYAHDIQLNEDVLSASATLSFRPLCAFDCYDTTADYVIDFSTGQASARVCFDLGQGCEPISALDTFASAVVHATLPADLCTGHPALRFEVATGDPAMGVVETPSCANGLVGRYRIRSSTALASNAAGSALTHVTVTRTRVADAWRPDPGCETLVRQIQDGTCTGAVRCTDPVPGGCVDVGGRSLCPGDALVPALTSPPAPVAGIVPLCRRIAVDAQCPSAPVPTLTGDTWRVEPGCLDLARDIVSGRCSGTVHCSAPAPGTCLTDNGLTVCPGNPVAARLTPAPAPITGIDPTCRTIEVDAQCDTAGRPAVTGDAWRPDAGCDPVFAALADGRCNASVRCVDPGDSGCVSVAGLVICPGDPQWTHLTPAPDPLSGIDRLCLDVEVSTRCPAGLAGLNRLADLFGHDAATRRAGNDQWQQLEAERSWTGEAYRTVQQQSNRSRPDLEADPIWRASDATYDRLDLLSQSFADCTQSSRFQDATIAAHVPDLRTCTRAPSATDRRCRRLRMVSSATDQVVTREATASLRAGSPDCNDNSCWVEVSVDFGHGTWVWRGARFAQPAVTAPVLDPGVVCADPPPALRTTITRTGDGIHALSTVQAPSCANGLVGIYRTAATGDRDGPSVAGFDIRLAYDTSERSATDEIQWDPPECARLEQSKCQAGAWRCTAQGPRLVDGVTVDASFPGLTQPIAPRVPDSPLCWEAEATGVDCDPIGGRRCVTAPDGASERCFEWNEIEAASGCSTLEHDPACGFLSSECKAGYTDPATGWCLLYEDRYDCGYRVDVPTIERLTDVKCAGPVRCLGADCMDIPRSASGDFVRAAAALQAAQFMAMDNDCAEAGAGCSVFKGKAAECKQAVGGIVDCCETPTGVSLAQYLSLITAIGRLDNAITGVKATTGAGAALRGAWETLRDPFVDTWSAVKTPFTSAANSLLGNVTPSLSDAATEGAVAAAKDALMKKTAEWVGSTFGPAAGNSLFSVAKDAGGVVGAFSPGGSLVDLAGGDTLQLGGGQALLGTAMSWAMTAYTVYSLAVTIIQLVWRCEATEFELGVQRQLRSCHRIGSYCKTDVLGLCLEERQAYCCFNSPLGRILQEQIRPQVGRGWGNPKSPACTGISVPDLQQVNWSAVNLDEWVAILAQGGKLPTVNSADLENLTGTGSTLNSGAGRLDASERTVRRLQELEPLNPAKESKRGSSTQVDQPDSM